MQRLLENSRVLHESCLQQAQQEQGVEDLEQEEEPKAAQLSSAQRLLESCRLLVDQEHRMTALEEKDATK